MSDEQTSPSEDVEGIDGQFLVDEYANLRRIGSLLILLALGGFLLVAIISAALQPADPPVDYGKVGVHLLLDDGRNQWSPDLWDAHMDYATQVVDEGAIVVQLIRADDRDPAKWQRFLDLCDEHGMVPVLRLATTWDSENGWWRAPQADSNGSYETWAQEWTTFVEALEWHTAGKHLILLNEVNNGIEWGGRPDPDAYARLVMDASDVLGAIDGVRLLNSALDLYAPNTGDEPFPGGDAYALDANTFFDAMHAAQPEVFQQFAYWNSHPYPQGAFVEPPWEQRFAIDYVQGAPPDTDITTPPDGIYNRGINGYEWSLWKLERIGITDIQVMITETGWRHDDDPATPYPTAATAADYLDMALRGNDDGRYTDAPQSGWTAWLRDPRVFAVAPFALNGHPGEWAHTNWLIMAHDGSVTGTTPLFDVVASYPLS